MIYKCMTCGRQRLVDKKKVMVICQSCMVEMKEIKEVKDGRKN